MLWQPVNLLAQKIHQEGEQTSLAMQEASSIVLSKQVAAISIPKRFSMVVRDIWHMQHRFENRHGRRAKALLGHKKFRAAYDFMCLRSEAGEINDDSCEWWTRIQTLNEKEQEILLKPARAKSAKRKPAAKNSNQKNNRQNAVTDDTAIDKK